MAARPDVSLNERRLDAGERVNEIARDLGVTSRTIRDWPHAAGAPLASARSRQRRHTRLADPVWLRQQHVRVPLQKPFHLVDSWIVAYQRRDWSDSLADWIKERPVLAASIGIVLLVVAINVWPEKEGPANSYNTPAVQRSESFDSAGYRSGCDDALYGTYELRDVASWVRTSGVDENQAMVDYVYFKSGYQAGWAQCGSDPVYVPEYLDREP